MVTWSNMKEKSKFHANYKIQEVEPLQSNSKISIHDKQQKLRRRNIVNQHDPIP